MSVVDDDEDVDFKVEFISNGNTGKTSINVPGPNDSIIHDQGVKFIGKGRDLRNGTTVVVSRIRNPLPIEEEDTIKVYFYINNHLLAQADNPDVIPHSNHKSETDVSDIHLFIKFPAI
ncbi:hypothetical protein [Rufibacter sp. XAAS-G3-1]|uniref:hypothetical protein n=1 Tax=Rufibacter sp. XAAS-G3-1 TaxID=2729134 RepID=UPI0015E71FCC|nr:hypothetical protein [Rufibacter sp. XAAS-G3-1]